MVKLAGEGQHYAALGELAGQCRNYVRDRNGAYESGVLPKLGQGGGLRSTDDGRRRMDPDGGIPVTKRQKPFRWTLERILRWPVQRVDVFRENKVDLITVAARARTEDSVGFRPCAATTKQEKDFFSTVRRARI